jgi:hypothetical protein
MLFRMDKQRENGALLIAAFIVALRFTIKLALQG